MIPYLVPVIITIFGIIQYDIKKQKGVNEKLCYFALFVYLVALIGLRYEVGGDTLNYMGDFQWRADLSDWYFVYNDNGFQPFYTLLCAIAKSISSDFYIFQLIHAFIFNGLLFVFLAKNTQYKFTALFLVFLIYYLYFSTEILREALAVFVFVFNYDNLKNNRWFRYYIGVCISCLFHISSVFLVVLPFMKWIHIGKYYFIALGFVILLMIQLNSFFAIFSPLSLIAEKISRYDSVSFGGYLFSFLNLLRYTIIPLFICLIARYIIGEKVKYENMLLILSLIEICSLFSFILFGRFLNYFVPFLVISITDILYKLWESYNIRLKSFSIVLLMFILLIYGSYYIHLNMYTRWIPYYSIYNPVTVNRDNF